MPCLIWLLVLLFKLAPVSEPPAWSLAALSSFTSMISSLQIHHPSECPCCDSSCAYHSCVSKFHWLTSHCNTQGDSKPLGIAQVSTLPTYLDLLVTRYTWPYEVFGCTGCHNGVHVLRTRACVIVHVLSQGKAGPHSRAAQKLAHWHSLLVLVAQLID